MPATCEAQIRPIRKVTAAIHAAAACAQNASATDPAELAREANVDLNIAERCITQSTKFHLDWARKLNQDIQHAITQQQSTELSEEENLVAEAIANCDRITAPRTDPEGPLPSTCPAQRARHLLSAHNARAAAQRCRQQAEEITGKTLQEAFHTAAQEMDRLEERNLEHAWSLGGP